MKWTIILDVLTRVAGLECSLVALGNAQYGACSGV